HLEQARGNDLIDGGSADDATRRGRDVIGTAVRAFVIRSSAQAVVGRHGPTAAAAMDDALAQCGALAWRPGTRACGIGCQALLVEQVLLPADIARVVVLNDNSPLGARLFTQQLTYRSVRSDDVLGAVPPEDVRASVGRIREDAPHA